VNVNDVDQLNRSFRFDASLTGSQGTDPQIACDNGYQQVVECIVQIDALPDGDIEIDLLRVLAEAAVLPGTPNGPLLRFTPHAAHRRFESSCMGSGIALISRVVFRCSSAAKTEAPRSLAGKGS
jgi:hypothetical protein